MRLRTSAFSKLTRINPAQAARRDTRAMDVRDLIDRTRHVSVAIPAAGLTAGCVAWAFGHPTVAALLWAAATVPVVAGARSPRSSCRSAHGQVGLDIVALLSMAGALALEEPLAGVVVALMYAGGQFLEGYAVAPRPPRNDGAARTGAEIRAAPRERRPRSRCRSRRWYPATGCWCAAARWCRRTARWQPTAAAVLDQSALTGEPLPVNARGRAPRR